MNNLSLACSHQEKCHSKMIEYIFFWLFLPFLPLAIRHIPPDQLCPHQTVRRNFEQFRVAINTLPISGCGGSANNPNSSTAVRILWNFRDPPSAMPSSSDRQIQVAFASMTPKRSPWIPFGKCRASTPRISTKMLFFFR